MRFGLLALVSWAYVRLLLNFPITADLSAWHAGGTTLLPLGVVVALAAYGLYVSLAGPVIRTRSRAETGRSPMLLARRPLVHRRHEEPSRLARSAPAAKQVSRRAGSHSATTAIQPTPVRKAGQIGPDRFAFQEGNRSESAIPLDLMTPWRRSTQNGLKLKAAASG